MPLAKGYFHFQIQEPGKINIKPECAHIWGGGVEEGIEGMNGDGK